MICLTAFNFSWTPQMPMKYKLLLIMWKIENSLTSCENSTAKSYEVWPSKECCCTWIKIIFIHIGWRFKKVTYYKSYIFFKSYVLHIKIMSPAVYSRLYKFIPIKNWHGSILLILLYMNTVCCNILNQIQDIIIMAQ